MPGSPTTPGWPSARVGALGHVAFHYTDSVGTRNQFSIAAQWLACTSPCRRFADILADAGARLGADVGRYSFIAVDLHHLLLAGLPAHLCENTQEPTSRRIVSSIALFPIAATALFVFRLTKSRRIFCAKIERLCFHTASVDSGPSPDLLGRQGSTVSGRGCEPCRQTLRRARPPHPVRGCPSPIIKSGQEPLCETDQL